jgi:transcriptional regulator with XRE-family HTH domain
MENMAKNLDRAKLVKKLRDQLAWPQQQLADVADLNIRTIQRLENDGAASFETLMAVANAFKIDVKELNPSSKTKASTPPSREGHHLPRLTVGRDLTRVASGADRFQFERDDLSCEKTIMTMSSIMNHVMADVVRWHDADLMGKAKIESRMTEGIKHIEQAGFYLFGTKRMIPEIVGEEKIQITMCTLYMSHAKSPRIIRDKKSNMMIPAFLTEVYKHPEHLNDPVT